MSDHQPNQTEQLGDINGIANIPEMIEAQDIYSETAVWLCENRKTRFKTRIQGSLAQILKQYPADYRLKLLSIQAASNQGAPHDRPATADQ